LRRALLVEGKKKRVFEIRYLVWRRAAEKKKKRRGKGIERVACAHPDNYGGER